MLRRDISDAEEEPVPKEGLPSSILCSECTCETRLSEDGARSGLLPAVGLDCRVGIRPAKFSERDRALEERALTMVVAEGRLSWNVRLSLSISTAAGESSAACCGTLIPFCTAVQGQWVVVRVC